jgi:excinuclease UvrABC ATPase subunit
MLPLPVNSPSQEDVSNAPGLRIEGARQNNLKNISLEIPHDRLTVVTGVSGSGKSSLAFDTLFAEGQWRYIESLSTYARMFLDRVDRPDVDRIENVRPAVALEQKNPVRTARSTVGTATEVYDYLRLLRQDRRVTVRRAARPPSPTRRSRSPTRASEHADARARHLPAAGAGRTASHRAVGRLTRRGFARVLVDGVQCDLTAPPPEAGGGPIAVVLDRLVLGARTVAAWWSRWKPRCARAAARSRSSWSTAGGASSPRPFAAARAAPRSSGHSPCSSRSTIRWGRAASARASATSSSTTRPWWCPTAR